MSVTLVKHYNPTWPSWFEALRHRFDSVLSGRYCSIEHVGSTSVAGMTAKPIIDVDIIIEPRDFESTKDRLAEIGYFHEGDKGIPGRDAFDLSDSGLKESLPAHHTYVCDKYGAALKRHLVFRDFLRLSPEYVRRLSTLKWQLAEEHDNDRQSYMDGKVALCEEIYEKGLEALGCRRSLYLPFEKKIDRSKDIMSEWFENEDFWTEMYPYMFPEERFESAEDQVDKILSLVEFSGTHILDLCCGPGRHSTILAERGFSVTGVDSTAFLLQKARARASERKLDVEFVQEDMRRFVRPSSYDLVLNMFTSFGYFDDKDEDLLVLSNIYESLRPGGVLVMDIMGKEWLAKVFAATSSEVHPDGTLLVQRREIFDDWTRIRNEWLLIRDEQVKSFKFHHTLYSGQELKDRLLQVGFSTTQLYGNLEGSAYGTSSKRLIALARKAAS